MKEKVAPCGNGTDAGEFKQIDVAKIDAPLFEREHTDEYIEKLQTSMSNVDQLQNIVVRKNGKGYQCISGWGRVLAQKSNGSGPLMAKIVDVDDKNAWKMMLAENLCRTNMTTLEREKAVFDAMAENKCSQKELAEATSISESWVSILVNAYMARQELTEEDNKKSSDWISDVVYWIRKIPEEHRSNLIEQIDGGTVDNSVKGVKDWAKKFNDGTDEDKERLLNGDNPFTDKNKQSKKVSLARVSSQLKYFVKNIDIDLFKKKKEKDRIADITNLKLSTSLLVDNMMKWEIITRKERDTILDTLKIKSEDIKDYLKTSDDE